MKFRALLNLTVLSAALVVSAASYAAAKADIVDTAVAAGSFNTLVTAVKAADLVDTLKGAGPFTVFAPTDEAFAALPASIVLAVDKTPPLWIMSAGSLLGVAAHFANVLKDFDEDGVSGIRSFPRIIGMRDGQLVFDLPAAQVSPQHLHDLYAQHLHELHGPAVAAEHAPDAPSLPAAMHCR